MLRIVWIAPTLREAQRHKHMFLKRTRMLLVAVAVAIVTMPGAAPAASLAQLSGMSELKGWFNAHTGRPRLILLLSPT
jgi:hypothetical protein